MNQLKTASLAVCLFFSATIGGCSMLNQGGYTKAQPKKAEKSSGMPDNLVELSISNPTGSEICRLHVRESALKDAYGWSSNLLGKWGGPKKMAAGGTVAQKVSLNKPLVNPDVHALDCNGNTVMRAYDQAGFASGAGATWTLAKVDQGTISAMQQQRGIAPSVHPLARKDPKPSASSRVISITLANNCSRNVEFCVVGNGESPDTSQGNTNKSINVNIGDKITMRTGSSCSQAIYTVTGDSNGQSVVVCK